MFPLPPLAAAALIALAALLATYLPRPPWLVAVFAGARRAPPIGWLLIGVVLGPLLGVLDGALLEGLAPVVACAIGWIAAGAAARLTAPQSPVREPWTARDVAGLVAAFVLPAALLYGAMRVLPPSAAPVWKPAWPVIAVLSTSVALAAAPRSGAVTALSLLVTAGALLALFPHARKSDVPPIAMWLGFALGGTFVCVLVAARLGRQPKTRAAATITALCLAAGIGSASGASPYLVCGLLGLALAKWGPGYERLADELAPTASTVAALLWFAAGALTGNRVPQGLVAAALLALWPALRRRFAAAVPASRQTLGLAVALSYALTAERTLGPVERSALVTAAALALLLTSFVPARNTVSAPLTSPTPMPEVTA
ncbi:MAG TPA: hypothetical protein VFP39_11250 [Gemmatimonadales bacterium]|nr:hypothetical protein [Gemmatimonadales bacterium]